MMARGREKSPAEYERDMKLAKKFSQRERERESRQLISRMEMWVLLEGSNQSPM